MLNLRKLSLIGLSITIGAALLYTSVKFYSEDSRESHNSYVRQDYELKYQLSRNFNGSKFLYRSEIHTIKGFLDEDKTIGIPSTHLFDFTNATITFKPSFQIKKNTIHESGTYNIVSYDKYFAPGAKGHLFKVRHPQVKEIKLDSDSKTIIYYFKSGDWIVYQNLTNEVLVDFVSPTGKQI